MNAIFNAGMSYLQAVYWAQECEQYAYRYVIRQKWRLSDGDHEAINIIQRAQNDERVAFHKMEEAFKMVENEAVYLALDALHSKAYAHPQFHSHHEAYGVLMEEVDEYFEHVREKKPSMAGCREELADVCAVCLKALTQLCTDQSEDA